MQHPYERVLEVGTEEIELSLSSFGAAPWGNLLLTPAASGAGERPGG
jgi:hypothetical protein